ncbi:hypothetical protein [Sphingobium aromaticiconvertens]|uniref:hypothetical protein n=1 Tax=Sphingobium aromaticiconvertens TaxID=365341 RepID=UPI0030180003
MRKLMFAALAGALALSACGKKEEQQPEVEATNNLVAPPDDTVIDANMVEPEAPTNATNVATPAPPPTISEDQQMLDDAAASGMTARLRQGGDGEPVADQGEAEQDRNANTPDL